MKVLLSAFSCGPQRGSEPGVGWNWVLQISRKHEVWVLTTDEFANELGAQTLPNVHFQIVPSFKLWRRLQKLPIPGLDWIYYYWWQWKAYRVARGLHTQVGFNLAHHVTFVSWRAPSFLCLLPVPFIWGPVGGGGTPPKELWAELGAFGRLFERIRKWTQQIPLWDPTVRLTMRRAAVIMAANRETARLVPEQFRGKVRMMLGIGMPSRETRTASPPPDPFKKFTVLFVGVLRAIKGGALALRAFQQFALERPDARLVFVGDGPQRRQLSALAEMLRVHDRVHFEGWLAREQVQDWVRSADVFLLPSLRDSGGMALMEAMAAGKPVVCLDLGGPGEIVTEECGYKIQPQRADAVVAELSTALGKLAGDPELRRKMGEAGRRRVIETFDWDKRGDRMLELYQQVCATSQVQL